MADDAATIAAQNLEIAKLKRQIYGPRSERTARLVDQMELNLEELEAAATEDEIAAERAAAKTTTVAAFTRLRPSRQPFPEHLPRERVIVPGPTTCPCCGGARLRKLGETVTETLEVIPRQWKVIQHVREKMTRRDIPPRGSTSCCLGIGSLRARRSPERPDHGCDLLRLHHRPCRRHAR